MAITNQTSLLAGASARQVFTFLKGFDVSALSSWNVGSPFSLWNKIGNPGPGASAPSSEIPTSQTVGALPLVDAGAGKQLYLGKMHARHIYRAANPVGLYPTRVLLRLYDRLYHANVTFSSATQTITLNGPTVTRGLASGIGNEIFIEEYGAIGNNGNSWVTYVNDGGTNSTTALFSWVSSAQDGSNGRLVQFPRLAADKGVTSIVSVDCQNIKYPPYSVAIVIAREIAEYSFNFGDSEWLDALDQSLPQIDNGSCLFLTATATVTAPLSPYGFMGRIEIYQQ